MKINSIPLPFPSPLPRPALKRFGFNVFHRYFNWRDYNTVSVSDRSNNDNFNSKKSHRINFHVFLVARSAMDPHPRSIQSRSSRSYSLVSPPIRSPPISSPAISGEGGVSSWIAVARSQQSQSLSFRFLADVRSFDTILDWFSFTGIGFTFGSKLAGKMKGENSRAPPRSWVIDGSFREIKRGQYRGAKRGEIPRVSNLSFDRVSLRSEEEGRGCFFFTPVIIHFTQPRYNATWRRISFAPPPFFFSLPLSFLRSPRI